ncbi:MAG: phosphoglycerate dehydrogenase [Lachnospiraceae bacterium]|nr:phosphoglycerate dehydrogenase [Lachnospiraceae bacterium]
MKKLVSFFGSDTDVFRMLNKKAEEYARTKDIEYVWVPQNPYDVEEVIRQLNDADAGLIDVEPYGEPVFSRMNDRCKLLIRFGVGYDKVDLKAASAHHIAVTRTTGANKTGVAEMALTQILMARRMMRAGRKVVESGVWDKPIGHETVRMRVGILGFGNIGAQLAELLQGFHCELLAYDTYHNDALAKEFKVQWTTMEEIFDTCDAISVHLPYSEETHHLIGKEYLGRMKQDAVIVCTARGNIIDEDALYEVLKEGRIGGAGLDVFSAEPFPADSKLIGLDNIVLSPHIASQTVESNWYTYQKAIDIMADFFAGKELGKSDLLNPEYNA